jgi:dUTP pyrophosphatase
MLPTFEIFLNHPDAKMPSKAHITDAGWDVYSVDDITIEAGDRKVVETGLHINMTTSVENWECQIRPRSGHAAKLGLSIVNSPATCDFSYTGPVKVILLNTSKEVIKLPKGSKIAQLVFQKVPIVELKQVSEMFKERERGSNGFGSTGT